MNPDHYGYPVQRCVPPDIQHARRFGRCACGGGNGSDLYRARYALELVEGIRGRDAERVCAGLRELVERLEDGEG